MTASAMGWNPFDDPEKAADLQRRDAEATAQAIFEALNRHDIEPPLTPEQVLESWKFACAGWRERAETAEAGLTRISRPAGNLISEAHDNASPGLPAEGEGHVNGPHPPSAAALSTEDNGHGG